MINKKELLIAIKKVSKVSKKSSIPVLNGTVLIMSNEYGEIFLKTTDLKCGITIKMSGAIRDKNSSVVVSWRRLKEVLEAISDPIEIEIEDKVSININKTNLKCEFGPGQFPDFDIVYGERFPCHSNFLKAVIAIFPIAKKADDEYLKFVLWRKNHVFGATRHVLGKFDLTTESMGPEDRFLMEAGSCEAMVKVFKEKESLSYNKSENNLFFYQDNTTFQLRTNEGRYPDRAISSIGAFEDNFHMDFDVKSSLKVFDSVRKICKSKHRDKQFPYYSVLNFEGNIVVDKTTYEFEISNASSAKFRIGVDVSFLVDAIKSFKGVKLITATTQSFESPLILTSKDSPDQIVLVATMRTHKER